VGIIADFFVATPAEAERYATCFEDDDGGGGIRELLMAREWKGITDLSVGTLWAILAGVDWDVNKHMLEEALIGEEGEFWLFRFPDELTSLLAGASAELLASATGAWAKTDEMGWDPQELQPVVEDLHGLAKRAIAEQKAVYLWGCL
jgi:hypothetical protein